MKKQTLYSFLFIISAILLLQQCKKDNMNSTPPLVLPSQYFVKEYHTNKPIIGANVIAYLKIGGTSGTLIEVSRQKSDSNGRFNPIADSLWIGFDADTYISPPQYPFDRNKTDYFLDVPAYIKIHAKNVNPYDKNDQISLPSVYPFGIVLIGDKVDTILLAKVALGWKQWGVTAFVYKNMKDTSFTIPCIVSGRDTLTVDVSY